jgi:hypothetical protein
MILETLIDIYWDIILHLETEATVFFCNLRYRMSYFYELQQQPHFIRPHLIFAEYYF